MLIGLVYDLRSEYLAAGYGEEETAEFDREDTIEGLEGALRALGHEVERVGSGRALAAALVGGRRWDLVFNIAEGLEGLGREAQVPALLELYGVPYTFSDALVMALSLHKGHTKRLLRDAGVPTPDFAVIERLEQLDALRLPLPLFAKPVAEGTSKGVSAKSVLRRAEDIRPVCSELLATFRQPVLLEGFLPGREFTVGIVGTGERAEAIGTLEVLLLAGAEQGAYSYDNKKLFEGRVAYRHVPASEDPVVRAAEAVALDAWRALGARDAGRVDLRCDEAGRPQFVEVNPLAGLNPVISDLPILCGEVGLSYQELIGRIVASASERVRAQALAPAVVA